MAVKELTGISVSDKEALEDTMRSFAFFSAEGSKTYGDELLEHLAMNALARFDPGGHSPGEVRSELKKMTGVDIENVQIRAALCRLVDKEIAFSTKGTSQPNAKFGLQVDSIKKLKAQYKDQIAFEENVISEWCTQVTERNPNIAKEHLDALVDDLHTFSLSVYSQHSVDTMSLYAASDERVFELLESFDGSSIKDILPMRDKELHDIRLVELPRFFQNMSSERKRYVAQQLNQVFLMYMFQLAPTSAKKLAAEIHGGFLIIDTNILISLFGLDGRERQEGIKRLLELSRGLGYRPLVTPQTVLEYEQKIGSLMHNSRHFPYMNREQAEAALTYSGFDELTKHYWRSASRDGVPIDPASVYEPYQYVDRFLEEFGIELELEVSSLVAKDTLQISEETSVLKNALDRDWKYDEIPAHDAFHRLLILRMRGGYEEKSPLEVNYWFLTSDTKLRFYDRIARKRQKLNVPFCVLASQWMQLLYPYRSAVNGFEETLANTFDSPLFRLFPAPPAELIHEIVSRMHMYKNVPESIVTKAIADKAFLRHFSEIYAERDKEKAVEEYILGELAEFESQLKSTLEREEDLKEELENLTCKQRESEQAYQQLQSELTNSEEKREELRTQIENIQAISRSFSTQLEESQRKQMETVAQNIQLSERVRMLESNLKDKSAQEDEVEKQIKELRTELTKQEQRAIKEEKKQKEAEQAQTMWRRRMTKLFLIVLVGIFAVAVFLAINPLALDADLRWLAITIPIVALVVSQVIMIYGYWPSDLRGKLILSAIFVLNIIALSVAFLKPFGIVTSDAIAWAALIIAMLTGAFEMFSFQRRASLQQ